MKNWLKTFGIIVGYIVLQLVAVILVMFSKLFYDIEWFYAVDELLQNGQILSIDYMNLIFELVYPGLIVADILMIIPFIIFTRKKNLHILQPISFKNCSIIFSLGIIVNTIISVIVNLLPENWIISDSYSNLTSYISVKDTPILAILAIGILAPIVEELVFRFSIIYLFREKSLKYQIFISAFLFGLAHMNVIQSTYAFLIGLLLAYMYTRKYNLLETILFHITVNTSSLIYEIANGVTLYICYGIIILCFIYYLLCILKKGLSNR